MEKQRILLTERDNVLREAKRRFVHTVTYISTNFGSTYHTVIFISLSCYDVETKHSFLYLNKVCCYKQYAGFLQDNKKMFQSRRYLRAIACGNPKYSLYLVSVTIIFYLNREEKEAARQLEIQMKELKIREEEVQF